MHCSRSQRGRPTGTGIDDSGRLQKIAAMIAENPELKPTTAIKNIGISDPSTIRRLRDKFNSRKYQLLREADSSTHREAQSRTSRSRNTEEARNIPLNLAREPVRIEEPKTAKKPEKALSDDEEGPACAFLNLSTREAARHMIAGGLRSASAIFHMQLIMATHTFHSPVIRSALRYQLAFSQIMLGFHGPLPAARPGTA
jgi:hypothetical protein